MEEELISVIVPIFKSELYLERCVNSIKEQTYKTLEIILVDDGSPDNCPQMCDDWAMNDERICVIHKKNGGASSARNAGMNIAQGSLLTFVDSDDWIDSNTIEILYKLLKIYNADVVFSEVVNREKKKKRNNLYDVKVWSRENNLDYFFRLHGEKSRYGICGQLIRRRTLDGFNFIEGRMNEDILACFWLAVNSRCTVYTDEIFYHYFQNPDGVTHGKFTEKKTDLLYIWNKVLELVDIYVPQYHHVCMMNCKRANFTLLGKMYLDGYDKKDKELQSLRKKLKTQIRKDYWSLMKWKMDISRKIFLTVLCVFG